MKNRVCITSVGRKVALVQAFKKAGWHIIGKDRDSSAIGLKFCDEVAKDDGVTECDLIVPTRDAELLNYAGLPFSASKETIETCLDKFKFYHWCKTNGFRTPEVYFVKPRVSKSGKETECVWQEVIEGDEYSVDLFADFDGNVISVIPRKRIKVLNGESCVTQTVTNQSIITASVELSTTLKLIGHNVLQCFMVANQHELFWTDVNLRYGGASVVSIAAGCKSPEWLLKLVNGEKVKSEIGNYIVGVSGFSYNEWYMDIPTK